MAMEYARVYLLDAPFCIDGIYDYYIPTELRGEIAPGCFVSVPFGGGNRPKLAVVFELSETTDVKSTKTLRAVVSTDISLDEKMLGLALFMKKQTLCTIGDAIHAMVPSSALSKIIEYYSPSESISESKKNSLSANDLFVLDYVLQRQRVSADALKNKFGAKASASIASLLASKLIKKELVLKDSDESRTETVYSISAAHLPNLSLLIGGEKVNGIKLSSEKHKAIIAALSNGEQMSQTEICRAMGIEGTSISAQVKALCEKGLITKGSRKISPESVEPPPPKPKDIILSDQQDQAFQTLKALSDSGQPKAALLFGITGSGKTSVILKTIDHMIASGKGSIILLPEISLTPQSIAIFRSRYGERIAVIHSGLSAGERGEAYLKIKRGEADVVLGTRSAIFAPVKNLGLIVIDEEQEHTYKSDMSPKYHARDIARKRCADENALMLLASATPSLESWKKATDGTYTLIKLTERYGKAVLPSVTVADMRGEARSGNLTPIGNLLTHKLIENQKNGGQSILFINRRGYNNFVSCRTCGTAVTCPNCSVAMTYHTKKGTYDDGELVCHWCGTRKPLPKVCPECGGEHLARMGYGTQRIEQELSELMDGTDAKILRMDTDTTGSKFSYDDMLGRFRRHEADVLLGTQMVTKGHDFPDVTLVGVLLADASLYLDDYRASERTFAMLTQVIGRAGRSEKKGLAVIQTNNPDSDVIKLACAQDYERFADRELKLRKLLVFPPFCDITLITLSGQNEKELMLTTKQLSESLKKMTSEDFSDVACLCFGPFEAPVYKVEGRYRMRMVIKCKLNKRTREMFETLLMKFSRPASGKVSVSIDFNPSTL